MSYLFTAANQQYMFVTSFATFSTTWSWVAWNRVTSAATNKALFTWDKSAVTDKTYTWIGTDNQMVSAFVDSGAEGEDYIGTSSNVPSDTWSMTFGRHGGATERIIGFDAYEEAANTNAWTPDNLPNRLYVGSRSNNDYWLQGRIAMLAFYSTKLSTTDIAALRSVAPSDHAGSYANCIAYYDMRTDQGTTTINDQKNSYHLTLGGTSGTPTYSSDNPTFTTAPSITTAPSDLSVPFNAVITGTNFGASQGAGNVYVSPTDSIADANKVTQTIVSWSATNIVFTATRSTLNYNTNMYLFVKENGGTSNASGSVLQFKPGITLSWST